MVKGRQRHRSYRPKVSRVKGSIKIGGYWREGYCLAVGGSGYNRERQETKGRQRMDGRIQGWAEWMVGYGR